MQSTSPLVVIPALRRSWPLAEKRRIVELTLQRGVSVQSVAKKYHLGGQFKTVHVRALQNRPARAE
jgi:transposase-like protein